MVYNIIYKAKIDDCIWVGKTNSSNTALRNVWKDYIKERAINMRTLKDILEVPLEDLSKGIKLWVDHSCKFWEDWLDEHNVSTAMEAGEEKAKETPEDKPEKSKIPDDLTAVIEYNKAIAEKYQATEADSLLNHLVNCLAKERGVKVDDDLDDGRKMESVLLEELKSALDVSPEKRELLNLPKAERAEHVVAKVIDANIDAITKIMNGDKDIIKELDEKVIEDACGTVDVNDLKFALRSMIQVKLVESKSKESDA